MIMEPEGCCRLTCRAFLAFKACWPWMHVSQDATYPSSYGVPWELVTLCNFLAVSCSQVQSKVKPPQTRAPEEIKYGV